MRSFRNKRYISASEAGRGAYCPHYLELQKNGHRPSNEAKALRARGEIAHQRMNRQAEDKRCYIASYLYGVEDPRTDALRVFRDTVLLSNRIGVIFVKFYYFSSPFAVSLAKRISIVDLALRFIVKHVHSYLMRGDQHGR